MVEPESKHDTQFLQAFRAKKMHPIFAPPDFENNKTRKSETLIVCYVPLVWNAIQCIRFLADGHNQAYRGITISFGFLLRECTYWMR